MEHLLRHHSAEYFSTQSVDADSRLSRAGRLALRVSGAALLATVVAIHVASLRAGHWPPGSPWSGFALVMQAVSCFAIAGAPPRPNLAGIQCVIAALGLTGALFWLAAEFMA